MFDFWYSELVPPSVCSGALPLLCPSCPLSRESSHVVAVFLPGWSLTYHLLISSNTRCRCSAPAPVMVCIALTQAVSYAAQAQVLEYFAAASSAHAGRSANCNSELDSLPVVPTVCTCTDGEVHRAGTSSLCCTCACHGDIALTQAVSYAAQAQVLEYFAAASSAYAGRFENCNIEFHSLPVVPTVYTCTCGGVQHAGTSILCCTCACHGVHRAPRKSIPSVVSSNRSFRPRNWVKVTLLRSLANSVSLQDNCLVDLDACILCRSNSVIRVNWLLPPHSENRTCYWLLVVCSASWPFKGSSATFWHAVCHYDERR